MFWRIEIANKPGVFDAEADAVRKDIEDLGIKKIKKVQVKKAYILYGKLKKQHVERIACDILSDNITEDYRYFNEHTLAKEKDNNLPNDTKIVEVAYRPGVSDPAEFSVKKAIEDAGMPKLEDVKTARQYIIEANISEEELSYISQKALYNKLIQHILPPDEIYTCDTYLRKEAPVYKFKRIEVDLLKADDDKLLNISKEGQLFLNLDEMKMIQKYFRNLGRNPTDCELETIAQTWSEHCYHKTFRSKIEYEGEIIDGLLESTIMQATKILNKKWCVSVFKDNSGIIEFDDEHNVCFKVETHNHPSALEPYGGASTGIGGVIRDSLGTGLGAKPIANTDVFCFGPPDYSHSKLPSGTLHPKRIIKGVVSGVRDYGNRMGIPTVNGAVLFDEGYIGNPLVYCGNVGLMPKDKSFKRIEPGDLIVVVGGKTGRDGIHGATFSSGELTTESESISSSAVQIGNPIEEKKIVDCLLKAQDRNLYKSITDCGAGGLSSAVGETAEKTGAIVNLEKVPLKYEGLSYAEIWISESQERMVLGVDKKKIDELIKLFKSQDTEATVIGQYTDTGKLELFYHNNKVCQLDMQFLHHGIPQKKKKAVWQEPNLKEPNIKEKEDYTQDLCDLLSSYDIASKEWIIRQYDHEVQGQSVLKPLGGKYNDGANDAACINPVYGSNKGLLISCGINPYYGLIDPYWMAINVIDEALRQIIASGGSLDRVAVLDNFCWGSPEDPKQLGGLVRASIGCHDASIAYQVPFISGKDSLNNEYKADGKSVAVPGTLLISALSVIEDVSKILSSDLKQEGNYIYVVGLTKNELGASAFYRLEKKIGKNVPKGDCKKSYALMQTLSKVNEKGLIESCHDCSEGGLAVALAEMAISGDLGAKVDLGNVPLEMDKVKDYKILFSESMTRFIVEVKKNKKDKFEKMLKGLPFGLIGKVTSDKKLQVKGKDGKIKISEKISKLKKSWQEPLRW